MPLVTFTTDFGTGDWFVGTMKGVIASISPATQVIDITHAIPPQDIRAGAFALMAAHSYFPQGTIHVAIVDPGVGSARKAIAIKTESYIFIGPDNGVLSWAARKEQGMEVRALENKALFLERLSNTFHGRDLFAPSAAHLANEFIFSEVGQLLSEYQQLPWPSVNCQNGYVSGEFIYFDHFGNGVTNIPASQVNLGAAVTIQDELVTRLHSTYSDVERGQALALVSSHGFVELAVNRGSARERFGLEVGDRVTFRPAL